MPDLWAEVREQARHCRDRSGLDPLARAVLAIVDPGARQHLPFGTALPDFPRPLYQPPRVNEAGVRWGTPGEWCYCTTGTTDYCEYCDEWVRDCECWNDGEDDDD